TASIALAESTPVRVAAQAPKPAPRLLNGKPDFTGVWDHPRVGDVTKDVNGPCAAGTRGCKNIGSGDLSCTPAGKAEWTRTTSPRRTTTDRTASRGDSCARTTHPTRTPTCIIRIVWSSCGSRTTAFTWCRPTDA